METEHFAALQALRCCTFLPGSYEKRFVRDLSSKEIDDPLTDKQVRFLKKVTFRYRKQIMVKYDPDFDFIWTLDHPDVEAQVQRMGARRSKGKVNPVSAGQLKLPGM